MKIGIGGSCQTTCITCTIGSFFSQLILAGLIFITTARAYGQTIRSSPDRLQNTGQDTKRLQQYVELADTLYAHESFDSLLTVVQRAIPLAVATRSLKYEAHLYYQLGLVYRHKRLLSKTLETLNKAISISSRVNDKETQARSMYIISTIYNDQGNYKKAISQCLLNLDHYKKHRFSQLELYTYDLLSVIYHDLGNTLQYKYYATRCIQMADSPMTQDDRLLVYSNIAQLYEDEGDYKKAWPYRLKAVNTARSMASYKSVQIPNLILAATNLRKRHQPKEAMRYLQDAARAGLKLSVKNVGGHIWKEMALVHLELGNYKQALKLAQGYVAGVRQLNLAKDMTIGLGALALAQEKSGYYQQALQSYKEYYAISDSLRTVEKLAQVTKVQALYDLEKKKYTIQLLQKKTQLDQLKARQQEQQLELVNQEKLGYIVSIILLTLSVSIVGYFLQRLYKTKQLLIQKKQGIETQARQLQESNQLKDRLFAIIGHDLRSPVASLKANFTLLKIKNIYSSELSSLEDEVDSFSHILDNILYWSLSQQNGLQPHRHELPLKDLVEDTLDSFSGFIRYKQLTVAFDSAPASVCADENMSTLVLRNILHNAFKFTPQGGSVRISIESGPDKTKLHIVDTGIGMNVNDAGINQQMHGKGTGIGLSLSKDLMRLNKGQLVLASQPGRGTSVTLIWPTAAVF